MIVREINIPRDSRKRVRYTLLPFTVVVICLFIYLSVYLFLQKKTVLRGCKRACGGIDKNASFFFFSSAIGETTACPKGRPTTILLLSYSAYGVSAWL